MLERRTRAEFPRCFPENVDLKTVAGRNPVFSMDAIWPVNGSNGCISGSFRGQLIANHCSSSFSNFGRIVVFVIANAEISRQSIFATFEGTFPSPRFPRATATLPQHGIAQFHAPLHLKITSSESLQPVLPTLRFSGAGGVELVHSTHAQNAPPHRAEMGDESAKSKGMPLNCTTFVVQFVPGLLTTLLSSENTHSPVSPRLTHIQTHHT